MNPISRLAQIQQAKKEKEPEYVLLSERGMPRRREFVMQVSSAVTLEIMPVLCYVQTQAKCWHNMRWIALCLALLQSVIQEEYELEHQKAYLDFLLSLDETNGN